MDNKRRPAKGPKSYKQPSSRSAAASEQGADYQSNKPRSAADNRRKSGGRSYKSGAAKSHSKPAPAKAYTVSEPSELLAFLLSSISNLSRNSVKSLLARGQVLVDGQPVTAYNHALVPGQIITLSKDKVSDKPALVGLSILHEDDDVIVIQKDAGLLSIASPKENEMTAYRQLMAHVRSQDPNGRIFVVHRLDRDTSGVMMFAKSEQVQQALQNTWQDTVKERTYVALVEGAVKKPEGTISSWLKESSTLKMYSSPYPNDGQHAITHYKTIESNRNYSLLEVNLETGRKNQIRVHMEDIGHPIVGDKKYGSKSKILGRLGLHAKVLAFTHPADGQLMRFESPVPKSFMYPFRQNPS
ncbi:RluA family pseudouridine synthase [Paenibacillus dakarensis]|uniref:RluA family pseudouridine synthase n=1 Tax=Paenibacillus dakarensis TaxID=1527293 RepID=UPI0006D56447|nr:RluA family pseudouridine synthase [Paenibacillus dakarensis]